MGDSSSYSLPHTHAPAHLTPSLKTEWRRVRGGSPIESCTIANTSAFPHSQPFPHSRSPSCTSSTQPTTNHQRCRLNISCNSQQSKQHTLAPIQEDTCRAWAHA
jgi:hypothetical protein